MYLDKFVHSNTGKILMSLLLGIGLATFFRSICKGKNCRIIQAPPLEEIEDLNMAGGLKDFISKIFFDF